MAGITFSRSSAVVNSIYGMSQEPIKMLLEKKVEAYENYSPLKTVFGMDTSNSFAEKYTSMTGMNGFDPVGEGGAYPRDEMRESFEKVLIHETWKDSFVLTQESVEDSKTMDMRKRPTAFIDGYNRTREKFGASLIYNAINGNDLILKNRKFSTKGADSKCLFATDHPSISEDNSKVQSNKFVDTFSVDNLSKAECKMQDFRDDKNEVLAVSPNTIIIPNDPMLKKAVFAATGADKDPETANNGFNFQFGRWRIIIWAYLNDGLDLKTHKPWILCDTDYNDAYSGAIWLERVKLDMKSYIDENTDNNVWKGRARFTAGFNDWRAFLVCGCASGSTL